MYVIVFTWVLLNASPLPIDAVNRRVRHVANSSTCCVKKITQNKKTRLSTSRNHDYKVKVTTKIATGALLTSPSNMRRKFILDTQIFVDDYIHSLVNKLQRIHCNLIWQHNNLYLSLDQSFNAKIFIFFSGSNSHKFLNYSQVKIV
jgi:hypothetical protein